MLVILSQKVDSESSYTDELFNSYHYPARYKNQLHKGDIFIYYQGNRYDKSQRYYFGVGSVGEIQTTDGENYYAKLLDCQQFERKVPIYLPDGGYIEQLGFETVRKSLNPPWQSSIRPLSQEAYDYILKAAGIQLSSEPVHQDSIDVLKDKLKLAVRDFYVEGNSSAIHRIESIASAIGRATSTSGKENDHTKSSRYSPTVSQVEKLSRLLDYCKTMRMSYSYKPILILALLHYGDRDGCISIENAAVYFREYYSNRKAQGLAIEKKQCIYLRDDVTDAQIIANLLSNPVKALIESGFFFYNEDSHIFSVSPDIWSTIDRSNNMSRIRGKDTKPEELVRKYLFSQGFRYRKNDARLPGKPDIVLPKYKTVIFVNGCFWHGHEGCHYFVWPKNNAEFWKKKIGSNIERDAKNHALLAKLGWNVIVVWECELKRSTAEETLNLLVHCIVQRQSYGNSN